MGFFSLKAFLFGVVISVLILVIYILLNQYQGEQPNTGNVSQLASSAVIEDAMNPSAPVRLRIPEINIDVPFTEPLGLDESGAVSVPEEYDVVGWYKHGPTPGALGPAVVLGHVDSYTGPAVFFYLGQLKEGSDIFVDREDGSTAHFVVTKMSRHNQNDFPTKEVYGDLPYAGLRLITCTGIYDRDNKRYTHNLIVYAKLVGAL